MQGNQQNPAQGNINQPALKKSFKARHLTMIALGGSIGTGLFLASGGAIASAGPGGALLAYTAVGVMVYFLMTSLGSSPPIYRTRVLQYLRHSFRQPRLWLRHRLELLV